MLILTTVSGKRSGKKYRWRDKMWPDIKWVIFLLTFLFPVLSRLTYLLSPLVSLRWTSHHLFFLSFSLSKVTLFLSFLFFSNFVSCLMSSCPLGSLLLGRFSPRCGEPRLLSSWGVWASHHSGSSCSGVRTQACGLRSASSRVLEHRLNSPGAWARVLWGLWDFSRTRDWTHVSCTGRQIFITETPENPAFSFLKI